MPILTRTDELSLPESPETARRNFWSWVLYQLGYRIGWQFKMESTMIAGLVSYLSPPQHAPAIMGLFTTVNSVGRCVAAAVLCWAGLAAFLWSPAAGQKPLALAVFLAVYTLFFGILGAVQVAQGTLLGKIIEAGRRGRALGMSVALSGPINVGAILAVSWLVETGMFPAPRS
jgi:hypothetical protein